MPTYLRPMAPTAPRAILCGDPARALAIAQEVLTEPRMSNHHRGLWGYHGRTAVGEELTVQATGIGGPSAAAVLSELAELGLRSAVRVGTCHAPATGAAIGETMVAERIVCADGTSASLGLDAGAELAPAPALRAKLERAIHASTTLVSVDRLDPGPAGPPGPVWDLQSAGLAALAGRLGVELAVIVVVAVGAGGRLEDEPLEGRCLGAARAGARALRARGESKAEVEA
jgi:hypothetical protein